MAEMVTGGWRPATRVGFRFCFLYFLLFGLFSQMLASLLPVPGLNIPDLSALPPMRPLVFWAAQYIFHYQQPLVFTDSGSGDKVFDWVLAFCLLVIVVTATCIWSVLDRRRPGYDSLYAWLRLSIRFMLAGQLFVYGLVKAIPLQMPFPRLVQLLEPYGNFSPMGVLWSSIGASPAYERFAGCAELLAGLLLIVPTLSMLGALICVADMIEVFALNMTYDVPVKLFSFHLMAMAAFLLLPHRSRLARMCLPHRALPALTEEGLFRSVRANRIAVATQILFGLVLFGADLYGMKDDWWKYGGGAPKSALYGIWNVDVMSIDGQVRAPLLTDYDRWRRVIFDYPNATTFQRMDDSFARFGVVFDAKGSKLALTRSDDKKWKGELAVKREAAERMTLNGHLGGHEVVMQLSHFDLRRFLLISRGFHWIQDYPFNR